MEKKHILIQIALKRSKNGRSYYLRPDVIDHTEDKIIERIYEPHRIRAMKRCPTEAEETQKDQR